MSRYIDADKLLDDLGLRKGITADEIINGIPEKGIRPMDEPHCWFFLSIMLAPTADVREVVHGEWVDKGDRYYYCSVCGSHYTDNHPYCPCCGARMVEEWGTKMNDMMPKEQSDFIEKVRDKTLESYNMDEHEAWDFAFRVWQGQNFLRERLSIKGSWEPHPHSREWDVCSVCGIGTKRREYGVQEDGREWMMEENYRYCPHCGADLKGGGAK